MSKFYEKKTFLDEAKKWAQKLKDSGFKDIEIGEKDTEHLYLMKIPHRCVSFDPRLVEDHANESQYNYYRFAGHFYYDYKFTTKTERLIWKLHSQGHSVREISKILEKRQKKFDKTKVHVIVKRLRGEMKKLYKVDGNE